MLSLEWEKQLLYPAGYFVRDIPFDVTLKLPSGWGFGSALDVQSTSGDTTVFKQAPLETLVEFAADRRREFRARRSSRRTGRRRCI